MIYELAILAQSNAGDTGVTSLNELVADVLKSFNGEVLVQDDWGVRTMAQATSKGVTKGHYLYYIFKADVAANRELVRRLNINDNVIREFIGKLGSEKEQADIVKNYKSPYSKRYNGSVVNDSNDGEETDFEKNPKRFARRRGCFFTAKNIKADWKDPATYTWLLNEFGKISPARATGVSAHHQKVATATIKRARQMGLLSSLVNRVME